MGRQTTSVVGSLRDVMGAARAASRRPVVRAALLVLGLALFVVLAVRAFGSLPETDGLAWGFAILLVVVTTMTNATAWEA